MKGLDSSTAALALHDAIREGALPGAIPLRLRRDSSTDIVIPHGTLPDGLLEVADRSGKFFVALGEKEDRSEWPTKPNPQDSTAFYAEHYTVAPVTAIGTYGDERDQTLGRELRELNERVSQLLMPTED